MARRTARARFVRPAPRTKLWVGFGVGETALAGNATTFVSSYGSAVLLLRPFTILRSRFSALFVSDQAAADETPQGSLGEIVASDTASALGVTALPNPSGIDGDPDADWYIWQSLVAQFEFVTAAGFESRAGQLYTIDSKAMRKVGPNSDSVLLVDMFGAPGATLFTNGRQLIQLH